MALTCTRDGKMLPALAIFKGKRQLKFSTPLAVKTTVQAKAWMDEDVMKRWFKGVIVPYTKRRKSLLVMDCFSAHETEDIFALAKSHSTWPGDGVITSEEHVVNT